MKERYYTGVASGHLGRTKYRVKINSLIIEQSGENNLILYWEIV